MKNLFFLLFPLLLINSFSLSAQEHQWVFPESLGNGKLDFIDSLHGFGLTNHGNFNVTVDGGMTWNSYLHEIAVRMTDLSFISPQEGWISGYDGTIAHTSDAGKTWTLQNTNTTENITTLHFIDAMNGWAAAGKSYILKTTDGGQTWTSILTQFNFLPFEEIEFIDTQKGWVVSRGIVAKTSDGGTTWTNEVPLNAGTSYITQLEVIDFDNVWFAGKSGGIQQTTDGGATWINQYDFTMTHTYSDLSFINDQVGWVSGEDSHLRRTLDGGQTWETLSTPQASFQTYGEINVFSADKAYLNNGYQITANGTTVEWDTVSHHDYLGRLNAFDFTDSLTGWGASTTDKVYKTTDGGCTWQTINTGISSPNHIRSIAVFGNTIIIGCTEINGKVVYSNDGGQTWNSRMLATGNSLFQIEQIFLFDQNNAYVRLQSNIYKTTDGGNTWSFFKWCEDRDVFFLDPLNGWIAGFSNKIEVTNNGGVTWSQFFPPITPQAIHLRDPNNAWVAGGKYIAHTTDAGQTWSIDTLYNGPGSISRVLDLTFLDSLTGWVMTANSNRHFKTTDGGQTWEAFNSYQYSQNPKLKAFSPTLYYIGGDGIVKYSHDAHRKITSDVILICNGAQQAFFNGQYFPLGLHTIEEGCDTIKKLIVVEQEPIVLNLNITTTEISTDNIFNTYQWFLNGNPIIGATAFSYIPAAFGEYHLEVVGPFGCAASSDTVSFTVVNTHEPNNLSHFNIVPNPTTGRVTLELSMVQNMPVNIEIYTVSGQLVRNFSQIMIQNNTFSMDFYNQPSGMYFVKVFTNGQITTKKMILNQL